MRTAIVVLAIVRLALIAVASAEQPGTAKRSPIAEFYLDPVRVVWQSDKGVSDTKTLLAPHPGQPVLETPLPSCLIETTPGSTGGVLLDFGREIQGHVQVLVPMAPGKEPVRARIRLGESASEAMAELGGTASTTWCPELSRGPEALPRRAARAAGRARRARRRGSPATCSG